MIFLSQMEYAVTDSLETSFNNTGNKDSGISSTSKVVAFVSLGFLGLATVGIACCGLTWYVSQRLSRPNERTAGHVQELTESEQAELRDDPIHTNEEDNQSDKISTEDTGNDQVWIKRN